MVEERVSPRAVRVPGLLGLSLALALAGALVPGCAVELGAERDDDVGRSDGFMTFEEFVDQAYLEPFEGGVWIVDGDTPVATWKGLRDLYEQIEQPGRLIVDRSGGRDSIWTESQRRDLTYCVSTSFGSRYAETVTRMRDAAAAWEAVADVRFRHVESEDSRCNASNPNVLFDVRPTSGSGYLARAFFPGNARAYRNVIVDYSCFSTRAPLTCTGVLRHELGHTLGFRHEHTRPEAGTCYEDSSWRPLTPYDRASVMHYPQCGGRNPALELSASDIAGVQAIYGPATGGGTPSDPPPPLPGADRTDAYPERSLARGERVLYGPFEVVPRSRFVATTTGTGDPDLYVRFDAAPSDSAYDCRSISETADERCELSVPATASRVFVEVRGYSDSSHRLTIAWRTTRSSPPPPPGGGADPDPGTPPPTPPADPDPGSPPPTPPPGSGTERSGRGAGDLARGALQYFAPLPVVPGTTFSATLTGSSDVDLYVRWDDQPSIERFDCRSATRGTGSERCERTVPAGASSARILVHAWSASSFELRARWTSP